MSRLLRARAARFCGWGDCNEWPDLLTDYEIAILEADSQRVAARDVLRLFEMESPPPDGEANVWGSYKIDGYWCDFFDRDAPPRPCFSATTYRDWPARDWEPSPLIAAWFDAHAPQDAPARVNESQGKPRAFTQERAEDYPLPAINESWREDSDMELIERRALAISWVIEAREFERMALENGDKGRIKIVCEHSEPELFKGSTVFDDAWKAGSKRQWWRMANHHKFTKNRAP